MAFIDVLVETAQHGAPREVSCQGRLLSHDECTIIDSPRQMLQVSDVINVNQSKGIRHALLLNTMVMVPTVCCGEEQDFI